MEYKRGDNILFILNFLAQKPGAGTGEIQRALLQWRGKDPNKRALVQYFIFEGYIRNAFGTPNRYVGVRWEKIARGKWKLTQNGENELARCKSRLGELKLA